MDLTQALQELGLSEKESQVYLACLKLGKSTATNIAKKANIKRSTTYVILEALVANGLASLQQTQKTTYYKPAHPKTILTKIQNKMKLAEKTLPQMLALQRTDTNKPTVEMFTGEQGLRTVYTEILQFTKTGKEVLAYGGIDHLQNMEDLVRKALHTMKNKRHKVRNLMYNNTKYEQEYVQQLLKIQDVNKDCKIKILPKQNTKIQNDNIIFGDKLAIFSTTGEMFVLVISSQEIADSYRSVFDMMWDLSKKIIN